MFSWWNIATATNVTVSQHLTSQTSELGVCRMSTRCLGKVRSPDSVRVAAKHGLNYSSDKVCSPLQDRRPGRRKESRVESICSGLLEFRRSSNRLFKSLVLLPSWKTHAPGFGFLSSFNPAYGPTLTLPETSCCSQEHGVHTQLPASVYLVGH